MMMEAVSGVVYGYVILGESIDWFTILGGTLILLASTMTILGARSKERQNDTKTRLLCD